MVGMPQGIWLREFGEYIRAAFGHMPYHVGSSVDKKDGWRDVDVRVLIPDDEWAALGLGDPKRPQENAKWTAITLAWSAFGQQLTGLPIDFQLQQQTQANAEFSHGQGCRRSALFRITDLERT